jgi:hypothetical protein
MNPAHPCRIQCLRPKPFGSPSNSGCPRAMTISASAAGDARQDYECSWGHHPN